MKEIRKGTRHFLPFKFSIRLYGHYNPKTTTQCNAKLKKWVKTGKY